MEPYVERAYSSSAYYRTYIRRLIVHVLTRLVIDGWTCATCSGALTNMERHTLQFLLGMGMITVLSFTWFAGGTGVLY